MAENKVSNFENVYTFKNVKFLTTDSKSGGPSRSWCVSGIEISLVENGIPKIEVRVDPKHDTTESSSASDASGLETFAVWVKDAQALAQSRADARLEFEVWKQNKLDQAFAVEHWVVTEAGLETGHDNFELIIVIQHPIVLTNFSSTSISSVVSPDALMIDSVSNKDMIEAIASTLQLYGTATFTSMFIEPPCPGVVQTDEVIIANKFAQEMKELASVVRTHLKWNNTFYKGVTYTPWPLSSLLLVNAQKFMGWAMANYFWGLRDTNLWDILAQQLVGQWFVSILPTYWDALTVTPTTPWSDPSIVIDDKDISVATFPGYERNIIVGVAMYTQGPDTGMGYGAWQGYESDVALLTDGVTYRLGEDQSGAIDDKGMPGWLISLMKASASASGELGAVNQESCNAVTPSNAPREDPNITTGDIYLQDAKDFRCVAYHCAHQIFLTQFKSGTQCNVNMRLMISQKADAKDHNDDIIPGKSCRITSNGTAVMDFYITMVVHRIDFARSVADTTLAGKYVRPPGGLEGVLETQPTVQNPMYRMYHKL
jgi:hypothetical protein